MAGRGPLADLPGGRRRRARRRRGARSGSSIGSSGSLPECDGRLLALRVEFHGATECTRPWRRSRRTGSRRCAGRRSMAARAGSGSRRSSSRRRRRPRPASAAAMPPGRAGRLPRRTPRRRRPAPRLGRPGPRGSQAKSPPNCSRSSTAPTGSAPCSTRPGRCCSNACWAGTGRTRRDLRVGQISSLWPASSRSISASTSSNGIRRGHADRSSRKSLKGPALAKGFDLFLEIVGERHVEFLSVGRQQQERLLPGQADHRVEIELRRIEIDRLHSWTFLPRIRASS